MEIMAFPCLSCDLGAVPRLAEASTSFSSSPTVAEDSTLDPDTSRVSEVPPGAGSKTLAWAQQARMMMKRLI